MNFAYVIFLGYFVTLICDDEYRKKAFCCSRIRFENKYNFKYHSYSAVFIEWACSLDYFEGFLHFMNGTRIWDLKNLFLGTKHYSFLGNSLFVVLSNGEFYPSFISSWSIGLLATFENINCWTVLVVRAVKENVFQFCCHFLKT